MAVPPLLERIKFFTDFIESLGDSDEPMLRQARLKLMKAVVDYVADIKAKPEKLGDAYAKLSKSFSLVEETLDTGFTRKLKEIHKMLAPSVQQADPSDPQVTVARRGLQGIERMTQAMELWRRAQKKNDDAQREKAFTMMEEARIAVDPLLRWAEAEEGRERNK